MSVVAEAPVRGSLDPAAPHPFDRTSALRRVVGEPALFLLLQRALVMEVAHTKVGAGVEHHSRFRQVPVRRLWTTMDAAVRLVFGRPDEARAAAQQVYRFHDFVHGEVPEASERWPAGETYTAHDATLLLWVWATLVDTADVAFERYVRPYRPGEADEFYADMRRWARFFGIPDELLPADRAAFAAYLAEVLAGPELAATPTSEQVVRDVLWFSHPLVPAALVRPLRVLAIGSLDPRLRDRLGLQLDERDRRLVDVLDRRIRRWYPRLPAVRTQLPYAYLALRRPVAALTGATRLGR